MKFCKISIHAESELIYLVLYSNVSTVNSTQMSLFALQSWRWSPAPPDADEGGHVLRQTKGEEGT